MYVYDIDLLVGFEFVKLSKKANFRASPRKHNIIPLVKIGAHSLAVISVINSHRNIVFLVF